MKKKFLLVLILSIGLFSCEKKCSLNYTIVNTEDEFPHFEQQNETLKKASNIQRTDNKYEKIYVDPSEIPGLLEIIQSQIKHQKRATELMKNEICNYSVQIVGAYDRDLQEKVYFLYFIYGMYFEEGDNTEFMYIMDGGDGVFTGFIRTRTKKFYLGMINGSA